MMNKDNNYQDYVVIEVYDGPSTTSSETISSFEELVVELKKTFGESVRIKYIDTSAQGIKNEKCQQLVQEGKSFPITFINGMPRMVGGIDVKLVRKFLDGIAYQMLKEANAQYMR